MNSNFKCNKIIKLSIIRFKKAPVESATGEAEGVSGRRGGGATVVEEEAEDVTKTPRRHGVEEEAEDITKTETETNII